MYLRGEVKGKSTPSSAALRRRHASGVTPPACGARADRTHRAGVDRRAAAGRSAQAALRDGAVHGRHRRARGLCRQHLFHPAVPARSRDDAAQWRRERWHPIEDAVERSRRGPSR